MVGPKPSTHVSCTIGGMIGNNSCGSTAQAYGKMADSVRGSRCLTYGGLRTWVGETSDEEYELILSGGGDKAELYRRLREIRDTYLGEIRTGYPKIPRRVSGYNLDQLLPENRFHVARATGRQREHPGHRAAGGRSSCSRVPRCRSLVVLGYPDIADAGDLVRRWSRTSRCSVKGWTTH
jgi:FAD/FMN-containing dehydrogenase